MTITGIRVTGHVLRKMAGRPRANYGADIPANSLQARVQATSELLQRAVHCLSNLDERPEATQPVSTCDGSSDGIAGRLPRTLPGPSTSGGLTRPQRQFQPPTTPVRSDHSSSFQSAAVGHQPVFGLSNEARTERNRLFNSCWKPHSALLSSVGSSSSKQRARRAGAASGSAKKKKLCTWNHSFVCLSKTDQTRTPSASERAELLIAGLGEKKISFDVYAIASEIHDELLFQFPRLRDAGGYELLRLETGTQNLEIIPPPPVGYSIEFLKAVVQQAKVYIRPLQRDLNITPCEDSEARDVSSVASP